MKTEMYVLEKEEADALLGWYRKNKRSFPWRDTGDPFDVWVSEIMLQQTRTEAVIGYFERFKKQIKDIEALSMIEEGQLLRLWEGLGYYSRARSLRKCALTLTERYGGKIPEDYEALLKLPGIGPYTAGAIMSIGFGRPYAAVDGNVLRVLSRYFALWEDIRLDSVRKSLEGCITDFYEREKIQDPSYIKDLSQAFMDLGAMICIPNGQTRCEDCPLHKNCAAFCGSLTDQIPYRSKPKARKIVRRTLFIIRNGDTFLLRKRPDKGLLAGLYEFKGIDERLDRKQVNELLNREGYDPLRVKKLPEAKHVFSHVEWHMDAYEIQIGNWDVPLKEDEVLVDKQELQKLAIPSAFKTYIDHYGLREERERV